MAARKSRGRPGYAAEFNQPGQVYAMIVGSTAGLGRVTKIDAEPVLRLPGVIAVLSHENAPRLAYGPHKGPIDPAVGERLHVLQDDRIRFYGQPVAVVVADTAEQASHAAAALRVTYASETPATQHDGPWCPDHGARGRHEAGVTSTSRHRTR